MASVQNIRRMNRVEIVDDERDIGNGLIVTLRKGWSFDALTDNRVAGADDAFDAKAMVLSSVPFSGPYDD